MMKFLLKHKYLIARRIVQIGILLCFAFGAKTFVNGDLSSAVWFDTVPLSDSFAVLQLLCAGLTVSLGLISGSVLLGALITLVIYALLGGRVFCAWVCPVNLITDFAAWLRKKLNFKESRLHLPLNLRYYILALSLVMSVILGTPTFESVSYIGIIQRGIIFGTAAWLSVAFVIFVVDTLISPRATCSHFCPLGAFYSLISAFSVLKIRYDFDKCSKCYGCVGVCPEKQVLSMVGKKSEFVESGECIRCGRCVEVCNDDAINFSILNLRSKK